MSSPLPDAAPTNWVDRWAPPSLRPWLRLGRFDRPIGIWLLMLPGWQGVALASAAEGRWPSLRLLALIGVGAAVMRAAGCAYNDIVDRDLDRKVARTARRPVASGAVGVRAALAYVVALSMIGLLILIQLDFWAIVIGVGSLLLVAAYPFMKRITWWPQAWLGLTFNWGVLVGAAAVSGPALFEGFTIYERDFRWGSVFLTAPGPVWLLYFAGVFWTLGYDTIYALQDLEDDALAGVKSSARRLGAGAPRAVTWFYITAQLLALAAVLAAGLSPFVLLLIPYGLHLLWQARTVKVNDPALALKLFKSNAWAGLLLFAGIVLSRPF